MKIVKFTQPNCTPCKMVEAFMNHAGLKADQEIVLGQDMSFEDAREKLGISSTPTIIAFADDSMEVELDRVAGVGQGKIQELFALSK